MKSLLIAVLVAAFAVAQDKPRPPQAPKPPQAPDAKPERWPASLPFPAGMVPHDRGKYTQSIYTTGGFRNHHIDPVSRTATDAKWHQSGGMQGVGGFRSDLYRYYPSEPKTWIADIPVWNGSNYQSNRGWKVEFAPGTKFLDVLSDEASGKVFEVRQREKLESGEWESTVLYEDKAARPKGYSGKPAQSCASCHQQAGTGSYGAGLVPGGDGVLSFGFRALERTVQATANIAGRTLNAAANVSERVTRPVRAAVGAFAGEVGALLDACNAQRSGLPVLQLDEGLCSQAQAVAESCASSGVLSHGEGGYDASINGYTTTADAGAMVRAWSESRRHVAIMRGPYTRVGFGVAQASDGKVFWTAQYRR